MVLAGIALVIFAMLKPRVTSQLGPASSNTLVDMLPWLLISAVMLFIVYRSRRRPSIENINKHNDAVALVDMGLLDEADAMLSAMEPSVAKNESLRNLVKWHRAYIQAQRGLFDAAFLKMQEVLLTSWIAQSAEASARLSLTANYIMFLALDGQTTRAEQELVRVVDYKQQYLRGTLTRAKLILAVRMKNYAQAAGWAKEFWREMDGLRSGGQRSFVRIVWAFALHQLDAAGNAAQIAELVAGVRPFWKGQFLPLGVKWPEMQEFLVQQKLTDEYATV